MNHWVWWFGRTTDHTATALSMKYLGDYLRLEKPDRTDTSLQTDPNNTWILLGIITGLPPYYPNGRTPEELEMNKYSRGGLRNQPEHHGQLDRYDRILLQLRVLPERHSQILGRRRRVRDFLEPRGQPHPGAEHDREYRQRHRLQSQQHQTGRLSQRQRGLGPFSGTQYRQRPL